MKLKNTFLAVKSLLEAKLYKKRIPLIVSWAVTARCNSRCKYCNAWNLKGEELETSQILCVIKELSRMGTCKIQFTGGEPLLRDDIGQIVDFCRKKGLNTSINSNGLLVAKRIGALGNLDVLCLSLDGPKSTHDYLRDEGSYDSVIQAANIARDKNIRLRFVTVLSNVNLGGIDFILQKAKEFDAPVFFQPATAHILMSRAANPFAAEQEEYRRVILDLLAKKKKTKHIANSTAGLKHLYNWPAKTRIRCLKNLVACRIESNGDVYICPRIKDKIKPVNCAQKGFKAAFNNLPFIFCDSCWCAANVELNCFLSLKLSTILNAAKLA
jgi:MoaA/NifB/PqqE/SkfB family radical SAM enzyme